MKLKPGTTWRSRYRIDTILGEGGFATVFRAYDLELNREVALKVLKPGDEDTIKRFEREARLLSQLKHNNIVSVYAFEVMEDQSPCLVLEYVNAESLAKRLERVGPLDFESCRDIFVQLADALNYAHSNGIVHRDLSAANILVEELDGSRRVKIIDFGISAILVDSGAEYSEKLTQTGLLIGNPAYMSPEQARGQKVDSRSDIYSFGCVLYQSLTGRQPFDAESPIGIIYQQQNEFPEMPKLSWENRLMVENYCAIAMRCLQKNPEDRYENCKQIKDDLGSRSAISDKHGLQSWSGRTSGNRAGVRIAVLSVLVAVLLVLAVSWAPYLENALGSVLISQTSEPFLQMEKTLAKRSGNPRLSGRLYGDLLRKIPKSSFEYAEFSLLSARQFVLLGKQDEALSVLEELMRHLHANGEVQKSILSLLPAVQNIAIECKQDGLQTKRAEVMTACLAEFLANSGSTADCKKCAAQLLTCAAEGGVSEVQCERAAAEICKLLKSRRISFDESEKRSFESFLYYVSAKIKLAMLSAALKNPGLNKASLLDFNFRYMGVLTQVDPVAASAYFERTFKDQSGFGENMQLQRQWLAAGINMHFRAGQPKRAYELARLARLKFPELYEFLVFEVRALHELGENEKAAKLVRAAVYALPERKVRLDNLMWKGSLSDGNETLDLEGRFLRIFEAVTCINDYSLLPEFLGRYSGFLSWALLNESDLEEAASLFSGFAGRADAKSLSYLQDFCPSFTGKNRRILEAGIVGGKMANLIREAKVEEAEKLLESKKAELSAETYCVFKFGVSCEGTSNENLQEAMQAVFRTCRWNGGRFCWSLGPMIDTALKTGHEAEALELLHHFLNGTSQASLEKLAQAVHIDSDLFQRIKSDELRKLMLELADLKK